MMKYTGTYITLFPILLRKHLARQFGKGVTKKAIKGAKPIYKQMLQKCDDIGFDNPMASNIYMCFVFLAIWEASEGAIDLEGYRAVIKNFMTSFPVSKFLANGDINDPNTLALAKEKFHKMQEWADAHPSIISKQKNCQRILIEEHKGEIEIKWDAKSKEDVKNILEYVLANFEKIVLT